MKKEFFVEIKMENEAMQTGQDICKVLADIIDEIEDEGYLDDVSAYQTFVVPITDLNGNLIGHWGNRYIKE